MIAVLSDSEETRSTLVSWLDGAGGETALAGISEDTECIPSIIVADGISAIATASRMVGAWGTPFLPIVGIVAGSREGRKAVSHGVSALVFDPPSSDELRFRVEALLSNSVFRQGDAVSARHLMRSMLSWSKRYDAPLSFIHIAPSDEEKAVTVDMTLHLLFNMRLSDHLCRLSSGSLLIVLPETSEDNARNAARRILSEMPGLEESDLSVRIIGGRIGHLTSEQVIQQL